MDIDPILLSASVIITTIMIVLNKKKKRRWTRNWFERRHKTLGGRGVLNMINNEILKEDIDSYQMFLRVNKTQFDHILHVIENDIRKQDTHMRLAISPRNKLEVTLRFLATGECYRSLMFTTRIHETTISKFVPEVCYAIIRNLKSTYLKIASSEKEWKEISDDFYNIWAFPHCVGAMDGRHIQFRPPISAGSFYYNYKNSHSIVLLAMCNATYKFTYVNIGVNGRVSDGGVFRQSSLATALHTNTLHLPKDEPLPGRHKNVPYVIVCDEAFPLLRNIMKPYAQRGLTDDQMIFNQRLSRARQVIECSFGILTNRFRILLNPISLDVKKVEAITLTCVILHNFLITHNWKYYVDIHKTTNTPQLRRLHGNNNTIEAKEIRDEFKEFININ